MGYIVRSPALPYSVFMNGTNNLFEIELNRKLAAACNPALHTKCHEQAVQDWSVAFGYNGEFVPYEQMTVSQRSWVAKRAQDLVRANG